MFWKRRDILSIEFVKKFIRTFLTIFGGVTVVVKPLSTYFPKFVPMGLLGFTTQIILSLLIAIIIVFPKSKFSCSLKSINSKVTIKMADLFEEEGHLVIGINDVFDTELGEVIKPGSIQGQFLTRKYHNDASRLDTDIETALEKLSLMPIRDTNKVRGKQLRYPIGTVATLGMGTQKYFLSAYSTMGPNLKAQATVDDIWNSLSNLWSEIRIHGQGTKVSMAVLGSDLARTSVTREILIKTIVLSFVVASKRGSRQQNANFVR